MATIRQQIDIPLSPDQVWETLCYPEYMELWNPKCVECQGLGHEARVGDRFSAKFQLKAAGAINECEGEVAVVEPATRIVIRFHTERPKGYVDESMELIPLNGGQATRVKQTLDMAQSGIPKWALWIVALIGRFGRPMGETPPLQELHDVCLAQAGMRKG